MRLSPFLFILFLFPFALPGQRPPGGMVLSLFPPQYREADTLVRDLNGDGHTDSLCYHYDGGSGFGGMELSLWDGQKKKTYYVNTQNSKWPLFAVVHADAGLFEARNRGFLRAIERAILPAQRFEKPAGSLRWHCDWLKYGFAFADSGWYSLAGRFTPFDYRGPYFNPGDYFIRLDSVQVRSLLGGYYEMGGDYGESQPFRQGWLVCYNSQMTYGLMDPGKKDTLLFSNKALISFSGGNFRYLYVDFSGDERWGGIEEAQEIGPLTFVKIRWMPGEYVLVVVDRDLGIWMRFSDDFFPYDGDYRLAPGGLRLREGKVFLPYGRIQDEMRRLKRNWKRLER